MLQMLSGVARAACLFRRRVTKTVRFFFAGTALGVAGSVFVG
jgi:hypothetical protein